MKIGKFFNDNLNPLVGLNSANYGEILQKRGGVDKFLLNWMILFMSLLVLEAFLEIARAVFFIPPKTFIDFFFILAIKMLVLMMLALLGLFKFLLINKIKKSSTQKWLEQIKIEREKQISKNGYKREHDDEHTDGSISDAAAHYASHSESNLYPWDKKYDTKDKHTREEQLVIACAMCIAELERLERKDKL